MGIREPSPFLSKTGKMWSITLADDVSTFSFVSVDIAGWVIAVMRFAVGQNLTPRISNESAYKLWLGSRKPCRRHAISPQGQGWRCHVEVSWGREAGARAGFVSQRHLVRTDCGTFQPGAPAGNSGVRGPGPRVLGWLKHRTLVPGWPAANHKRTRRRPERICNVSNFDRRLNREGLPQQDDGEDRVWNNKKPGEQPF